MSVRDDIYLLPNVSGPTEAVRIDESICIACNACAKICRSQTIMPSPEPGEPPVLVYPDECWFCGSCVEVCPTGALEMRHPIAKRIMFRDKETGQISRIGQKDPLPKTYFKAPYGLLDDNGKEHEVWVKICTLDTSSCVIFTEEAAEEIAKTYHEQGALWKCGAAARLFGFDTALLGASEEVQNLAKKADAADSDIYCVIVTNTGEEQYENCTTISASAFAALFRRACVSMFTAVQVWKSMGYQSFDHV